MASSPSRICWDACAWIALIQKEQIRDDDGNLIEDRYALARSVIDRAEKGGVEIVASGLCLVEVNKDSQTTTRDQLVSYFENDYIILVPLDKLVGERARSLMFDQHPGLKPADATHLATALIANVDEFNTFDSRLLRFDGQLTKRDGTILRICKPAAGGEPLPLFEEAQAGEGAAASGLDGDFSETLILEALAADANLAEREAKRGAMSMSKNSPKSEQPD
jgi:predicted nucleic acid-binding protein